MKLMYHRELGSYLILDGKQIARIGGPESGVFWEKRIDIILAFGKYCTTWYDDYDIGSELQLITEFNTREDLRDKFAEDLI